MELVLDHRHKKFTLTFKPGKGGFGSDDYVEIAVKGTALVRSFQQHLRLHSLVIECDVLMNVRAVIDPNQTLNLSIRILHYLPGQDRGLRLTQGIIEYS